MNNMDFRMHGATTKKLHNELQLNGWTLLPRTGMYNRQNSVLYAQFFLQPRRVIRRKYKSATIMKTIMARDVKCNYALVQIGSHFCQILTKNLKFSTNFSKKANIKFRENPFTGIPTLCAYGRTSRHDEATLRFSLRKRLKAIRMSVWGLTWRRINLRNLVHAEQVTDISIQPENTIIFLLYMYFKKIPPFPKTFFSVFFQQFSFRNTHRKE
jgi:hypothetical protein